MTGTGEHVGQAGDSGLVSRPGTTVALVVPTDEELLIARDTARLVATVATAGRDR
jgi:acetate kinase